MSASSHRRNFVFHKPYPVASENEVEEIPKDLVRDEKKSYKARPAAISALRALSEAAKKEGADIIVISSHRALEEQSRLFADGEVRHGKGRAILWLAPPGYSEHHTGYVFDLADRAHPETDDEQTFEGTPAFRWLQKNAEKFGFELSFPPENWQGISYEPWHWRFVGNEHARNLFHPEPHIEAIRLARCLIKGVACRIS